MFRDTCYVSGRKHMKKLNKWQLLMGVILLFGFCTNDSIAQTRTSVPLDRECYQSFEDFAYWGPLNVLEESEALPLPPWEVVGSLPSQLVEEFAIDLKTVEITRLGNGKREIWLSPKYQGAHVAGYWVIYRPESQTWEIIPDHIEDLGLFVAQLFVSNDNILWGRTFRHPQREYPDNLVSISVLSRFNEITRRFELVADTSVLPLILTHDYPNRRIFEVDDQDTFWIFAENDGIFRYDPTTQILTAYAELPNLEVIDTALAPDGNIYFSKPFDQTGSTTRELFTLTGNPLLQFVPKTGEVTNLEMPSEDWPIFSGMLVDHGNRLWLGAIGYRESNNDWQLIHPNPETYFDHAGDHLWAPPVLMMESSDGRLWYSRYLDSSGRGEGTAWYDPNTGEGCMFTNVPTNIVEDSQQNLWMVVNDQLYRYPLSQ